MTTTSCPHQTRTPVAGPAPATSQLGHVITCDEQPCKAARAAGSSRQQLLTLSAQAMLMQWSRYDTEVLGLPDGAHSRTHTRQDD